MFCYISIFFYFFPISLYIYFLYLELQCPEPEPPSNGKIIIKSKSGGNQLSSSSSLFNQTTTTVYLVGDYIQFGCRKGYRMIGSDIITCLHTEQWSSLPPKCKLFFFRFQKMEFNLIQLFFLFAYFHSIWGRCKRFKFNPENGKKLEIWNWNWNLNVCIYIPCIDIYICL